MSKQGRSTMSAMRRSLEPRFRSKSLLFDIEIKEFIERAVAFEADLAALKAPADFGWYPYDSIGTLSLLDRLLTGPARFLRTLASDGPVLDLGCGDGLLSFAFEALGANVYAIDNPSTNYNGMRGVRTLKRLLHSTVRIEPMDLDYQFTLPAKSASLALFFGTLYHLKNPFGALESLGRSARHCLLSTAVTRVAPDQRTHLRDLPVACIADRDGLKGDDTNYWIFSEEGLRRLLDRAGWEILDWLDLSDDGRTLWGAQPDERVLCLLRSRTFPPVRRTQLLRGWHALENNAWRWTERRFSILAQSRGIVTLRCTVPPALPHPITLKCGATEARFEAPGEHEASFPIEQGEVTFEIDRWLEPDSVDGRERGLIVRALEM